MPALQCVSQQQQHLATIQVCLVIKSLPSSMDLSFCWLCKKKKKPSMICHILVSHR